MTRFAALLLYGFTMCAIGAVLGLRSVFWQEPVNGGS